MGTILKILPKYIRPIEIKPTEQTSSIFSQKCIISIDNLELGKPELDIQNISYKYDKTLYPSECRERQINYNAPLQATITMKFDNSQPQTFVDKLGYIPIMVQSDFCNLKGKNLNELIKLKEDIHDFGGYFIINGLEKLIRMITITRRNYPIAYVRPSAVKKKLGCSEFVCEMKCVREDLTSHTISLHYMNDGTICLRILIMKQELMIPLILILKALLDCPDMYLYNRIVRGNNNNSKLTECVEVLIADGKKYGYSTKKEFLSHLGRILRNTIGFRNIMDITNEEVGIFFIKEYICIHANDWNDKFNILCLMSEKLYSLSFGIIKPDNYDAPTNHEILLSGHLYIMILKEKITDMLNNLEQKITLFFKKGKDKLKAKDINWLKKLIDGLVQDCQAVGIETKTIEEINSLLKEIN
jgi:DNA-directed RNA polymerase I subunit RPA2